MVTNRSESTGSGSKQTGHERVVNNIWSYILWSPVIVAAAVLIVPGSTQYGSSYGTSTSAAAAAAVVYLVYR